MNASNKQKNYPIPETQGICFPIFPAGILFCVSDCIAHNLRTELTCQKNKQPDYKQHSVMKTSETFSSFDCLSLFSFPDALSGRPFVLVSGFRMMSISCCNGSGDPDFEESYNQTRKKFNVTK